MSLPWLGVPSRAVVSRAPVRICDNGGWTDTWFAGHGRVFNIAVTPLVEIRIEVFANDGRRDRVLIVAANYRDHYTRWPENPDWDRHPLVEAAIRRVGVPEAIALRIRVFSEMPAGAGTGTSAAVAVALVGALTSVASTPVSANEAAALAHSIETHTLGWQAGVQDQVAAAHGGLSYIEVDYPRWTVRHLEAAPAFRAQIAQRLSLIYLGHSHRSSEVHEMVIAKLTDRGPDCAELEDLRHAADASRDAVLAGDVEALGRAMCANTDAQARLHPDLVSADARALVTIARDHGAIGWKVNGAGGVGGSVAILAAPDPDRRRAMFRAIGQQLPATRAIPVSLSASGLHVLDAVSP
jgi:D-glycero-alpha-D-manno-heptose-7-phosphate kinase